jgi:hypothetical protein
MTAMPDDDLASILAGIEEDEIEVPEVIEEQETNPLPSVPNPITTEPNNQTEANTLIQDSEDGSEDGSTLNLNAVYDESVLELLANYRQDRADIDSFMNLLYERINNNSNASRVFYETLAMSLRTRSEANNNLLKLIDNINKRSDKSGSNFNLEDLLGDDE